MIEQKYTDANFQQELADRQWHTYVCHTCKRIYWHARRWCDTCPGETARVIGPTDSLQQELHDKGYKESGV